MQWNRVSLKYHMELCSLKTIIAGGMGNRGECIRQSYTQRINNKDSEGRQSAWFWKPSLLTMQIFGTPAHLICFRKL